ncbi:tRNA pseudouridine synthase A 1 isoform X1 [Populus alba x Populus x berolinensis]|nr:tRNA pseudouridine synthase A 1 isoform X1 [Populus alba x Populus x berolinensis]
MTCYGGVAAAAALPSLPPTTLTTLPSSSSNTSVRVRDVGSGGAEHHNTVLKPTVDGFKWRLLISYDGTHYKGWQFQQTPPTIQCILEKALTRATKLGRKDLHLVGASRTDGGVHAWGQLRFQVAHFVTPFNYDSLDSIHAALNGLLPPDIRVREISAVVPEFHARFSAKGKTYHYKIFNDAVMDPFQRLYAYHVTHKLNAAVMREAANHFIGTHDFSAFVNSSRNDGVPNPVKTIFRFDIIKMGALLQLEVEGSGFMYRQVRNMVALLLQIGKEAIAPDIVPKILSTRDRKELAKYTLAAPPQGLCLVAVKYNEEHLQLPLGCPTTSLGRHHSISKCKVPFY